MTKLPLVIAGPILRKTNQHEVTLFLATSQAVDIRLSLLHDTISQSGENSNFELSHRQIKSGDRLYLHFIHAIPSTALPTETWIGYDITLIEPTSKQEHPITEWAKDLCYEGKSTPGFIIKNRVDKLLHGSCRKPHHKASDNTDGLALVDSVLSKTPVAEWPALLILSGDQIYADDVAGPMLFAIHQVIEHLGLPTEKLAGSRLEEHEDLHSTTPYYYQRNKILPQTEETKALQKQFFGGVKKPVFTTTTAQNHLITLSEVIAMYLLVLSPTCWADINLTCPPSITNEEQRTRYQKEKDIITGFQTKLHAVQRALAHLPTAMIFDDHDVTDDWNMTAAWEKSAYEHPLSRRIIGNALIGYMLFQGWGNTPEKFDDHLMDALDNTIQSVGTQQHDDFISKLLKYHQWHYQWPTSPALIVLDSRTQRWRSEKDIHRPSGLMDWEALTDLQQTLIDHEAVILISPAPIFGVKFIEVIQRIFTFLRKPLMVDAENWMAHPGSAYALMNLFRHPKTPHHFVILSGDVHYSFAYDIKVKGQKASPEIWQITSSGIRNEFPHQLLNWLDRLNRWFYAPWSPLNLLTKRRGMWVSPRKPAHASRGERLLNHSGIGLVELDKQGKPTRIEQIISENDAIRFEKNHEERKFE